MLLERLRRLTQDPIAIVVAVEIAVVALAAVGVYAVLLNQYTRVVSAVTDIAALATAPSVAVFPPTPSPTPTLTSTLAPTTPVAPSPAPVTTTPSSTWEAATATVTRITRASPPATTQARASTPRPSSIAPAQLGRTIADCGSITSPGNYKLAINLVTGGDCLKVQTSNVILDCDGHSIRGTGYGGSGISVLKFGILNGTTPNNVEIRNCQLSNFRFGIYVEAGSHLSIHDNASSDNFDDTDSRRYGIFLGMTEGGGIRVNSATDSSVANNVTKNEGVGIDVRYSTNVTIAGNTSSDNSAWGINLYGTSSSTISGNTTANNVRRCTWGGGTVGEGCDSGGIVLQGGSSNNTVSANTVSGRNGNGIFIKAHGQPCGNNNSILNNTITSVMYNSIELSFCAGNRILGNTIRDGLDGIWLGYSQDTTIQNNTIQNMDNHGIISSNSHNNVITSNQIIDSNEAMYFYSEPVDRTIFYWLSKDGDYASHHNCLCSNLIQSNTVVGIRLKDSTNNQVTGNTFQWNGKNVITLGNGQGNDLSGNTTVSWLPSLGGGIAMLSAR